MPEENNAPQRVQTVIIGAGLSGLTTAYHLYQSGLTDFVVLESRDRIGGRILTEDGIDYGATWFQTHHERVGKLLTELGIERFQQYSTGRNVFVYSSMAPAQYFVSDPKITPASRIAGGSSAMIHALADPVQDRVYTSQRVRTITRKPGSVTVGTDERQFEAQQVVVTVPPRIATRISFSPELPEAVSKAMTNTHTWMSNAIKIGMTFERPFWREKGLSGTVLGQVGPVVELYDHSNQEDDDYSLMGFINEALRDASPEKRQERILNYLSDRLGVEVRDYLTYTEKDWSEDEHTSCTTIKSIYMSPEYGHPAFQKAYWEGRLHFSGAETATQYGGYMDGAIHTGLEAAKKVMHAAGDQA